MKTNRPILLTAVLALTAAAPFAKARNASDLVRIEVGVESERDRKEITGSTTDTVTQKKILQITISGKPKSPETRTCKWTAYGRGLKSRDVTVLQSGEFKIEIPATGQQKIVTKVVPTTSTAEHFVNSGSGRRSKAKKVEASGTKYIGYGVVVKDGDQIAGEIFNPAGLKREAAK